MPPLRRTHFVRAILVASFVFLSRAPMGSRALAAQLGESTVAADSDLELLERAESGAYQTYWVKLSLRNSIPALQTRKDDVAAQYSADLSECLTLWRGLLAMKLDTLGDATAQPAFPDQSHFTLKYRVGQTAGGFSVYGVDSLADDRYRKVVGAILDLADKYSGRK
jgi:hypothetical protein